MKTLYEKNPLLFSLLWIGVYVVLFSAADGASSAIGVEKLLTAPVALLMGVFLVRWIKKHDLSKTYGLVRGNGNARYYLYYLPLVLLVSANLWGGATMHLSVVESALYVVTMLGVGLIEEILFRGFLFKTLCEENVTRAIVISSITFGIGHIVNLLNGAELLPTLLQILYASAIGYLFTILFHRSGSLIPCIVTHGLFNALSCFAADRSPSVEVAVIIVLIVLPVLYASWILRADVGKKE